MFGEHFYHAQIRRMVSVFGTLFNNINVRKTDNAGKILQEYRVPLAYGPRQKFLARVQAQADLNDSKLAIKLPRMSFEMTGLTYDTNTKVHKTNEIRSGSIVSNTRKSVKTPTPYRMTIELNIMTKNQDEALQILEQILPHFQPEYNVTINEIPAIGIKSDVPIVLSGVTMNDSYEGDFETRRAIIYTLSFETRVKFYGAVSDKDIIRTVTNDFFDFDLENEKLLQRQTVTTDPTTADRGSNYDYTIQYGIPSVADNFRMTLTGVTGNFNTGETINGQVSGASAEVVSWDSGGSILLVENPTAYFDLNESIQGASSSAIATVDTLTNVYV